MRMPLLFVILLVNSATCRAQTPSQWWWFMKDTLERYAYAGGDEFDGRTIDREKWMAVWDGRHNHHGTHSQEYTTDGQNLVFDEGMLWIRTRKEELTARGIDYEADDARLGDGGPNLRTWHYTSGALISKATFQFGVFEASIKLPSGQGAWPSFWLFGGQPNEEIDIFEGKGEKRDQFHVDVHCPGSACADYRNPFGKLGSWLGINWPAFGHWKRTTGDLTTTFNEYVGEWRRDALRWYMNGEQCAEWKGTLLVPEHLILQTGLANTCEGCPFGPGPLDPMEPVTDMVVDHVRIWRSITPEEPLWNGGTAGMLKTVNIDGPLPTESALGVTAVTAQKHITVRGGKKGKVRKGFRVKSFPDPFSGSVRLEVQGEVPKAAYVQVQDDKGSTLIPKQRLAEGTITIALNGSPSGVYLLIAGDGEREVQERISAY